MDEFVGVVKIFGGNFAPVNWLPCDGRSLPISQYEVLYTLIGTTYGGDGVNNFNLPNLNGAVPVGTGKSATGTTYALGQKGGSDTFVMTTANMPAHAHAMVLNPGSVVGLKANGTTSSTNEPKGNIAGATATASYAAAGVTPMMPLKSSLAMGLTGDPAPAALDNRSPFMAMNYIICTVGIWPSSN